MRVSQSDGTVRVGNHTVQPDTQTFISNNQGHLHKTTDNYNYMQQSRLAMRKYGRITFAVIVVVALMTVLLEYGHFIHKVQIFKSIHNQSEIEDTIRRMRERPALYKNRIVEQPNNQIPSPQAYFAYRLYLHPNQTKYQDAQYYYYNSKYKLDDVAEELPMCIVSVGRNLNHNKQRYRLFLDSISRLNYTNYRLIFTDDASDDGTVQAFKAHLSKHTYLSFKTKIIQNRQRKYALHNKDLMIRNECNVGDIIVDIDADDELIGRQALKVYNAIYSKNTQIWLLFSNNLNFNDEYKQPLQGSSTGIKHKLFKTKRLRTQPFRIMHLRSFRKQVFQKIPHSYFIDQNTDDYHRHISDGFIYVALAELSGQFRVKYLNQIFYYYYRQHRSSNAAQKKICSQQFKLAIPFQVLQSIRDTPKTSNITYPQIKIERIKKRNEHVYSLLQNYQSMRQFDVIDNFQFQIDQKYETYIQDRQQIPPSLKQPNEATNKSMMQKVYLAYNMQKQQDSKDGNLAMYYYYNKKYKIGKYIKQQQICIIVANDHPKFYEYENYIRFIDSIAKQNYTNYHIQYMQYNQNQNEGVLGLQELKNYVDWNLPWMRINYVKADGKMGSNSRNMEIDRICRNSCSQDSIILLVDGMAQLNGRQIFKLVNSIYYDRATKMAYGHGFTLVDIESKYQKMAKIVEAYGKAQSNQFIKDNAKTWQPPQLFTYRKQTYEQLISQQGAQFIPNNWIHFFMITNSQTESIRNIEQILLYTKQEPTPLLYLTYSGLCQQKQLNCQKVTKNRAVEVNDDNDKTV